MGIRTRRGSTKFFFPIGDLGALESDFYFLAEVFGPDYIGTMAMPWSRRKRIVEGKKEVERKRKQANRQTPRRHR